MILMRVSDQSVSQTYAYVHSHYDLPAGVNKSGNKERRCYADNATDRVSWTHSIECNCPVDETIGDLGMALRVACASWGTFGLICSNCRRREYFDDLK